MIRRRIDTPPERSLNRKPLRLSDPKNHDSEPSIDLSPDSVLSIEQRLARDIALASLANQRRKALPDVTVN